MILSAVLAIVLLFGSNFTDGTSLEWLSAPIAKLGPFLAGLIFPNEGDRLGFGPGFFWLVVTIDCLMAWVIALLLIEVVMMLVQRGMHRE
jgi:hypothetical protein